VGRYGFLWRVSGEVLAAPCWLAKPGRWGGATSTKSMSWWCSGWPSLN